MEEEMEAISSNKTWTLVPKHPKMNIIGSKWVFNKTILVALSVLLFQVSRFRILLKNSNQISFFVS